MYYIKDKGIEQKEIITITDYLDIGNQYRPKVEFNLTYSDVGFHVHFDVFEKNPLARYTEHFSPVCRDSCVEWFINFDPKITGRYFNFEVNAKGTMDLAYRLNRYDYVMVTNEDIKALNIITKVKKDSWSVDYTVSFDFIKKYITDYEFKKGMILKSNVYKCGEDTEFEHYGCWSKVDSDFHAPQYFEEMQIV